MIRRLRNRTRGVLNEYRSTVEGLAAAPVELTYQSDGDTNGVAYYLGTNGYTEAWTNPHTAGRLTISGQPALIQGSIEQVVDRVNNTAHTNIDAPNNYFQFDLGAGRSLILKKYSFRNRQDSNLTIPVNVALWASNDNVNYIVVASPITHVDGAGVWNTKTVATGNSAVAYRYWRFHSNANNSSSGYMTTSEIELYGTLYLP